MSEFTRDVLEGMTKCNTTNCCSRCSAHSYCKTHVLVQKTADLARALLAEMDKPKDDVWKDAPVTATKALVAYYTNISGCIGQATYTRELPKSRARVIAEEAWADCHSDMTTKEEDIKRIESAILKALAEKEAGK